MNHVLRTALSILLIWVESALASEPAELTDKPRHAEPLENLPAHVIARDGEITLYADYGDLRERWIVLYLVNRTSDRIALPTQDGDISVKLEVEDAPDVWIRAQRHYNATCGNSFYPTPSLRPGEFFRFLGRYPKEGEPRRVRYRIYHDTAYSLAESTSDEDIDRELYLRRGAQQIPIKIVSNEGYGRVEPFELIATRNDGLSLRDESLSELRQMVRENDIVRSRMRSWTRVLAARELRKFRHDYTADLLTSFLADPDAEVVATAIQSLAIIGPDSVMGEAMYQQLLGDNHVGRRSAAIASLGKRAITPEILANLGVLLNHPEKQIREAAVFALADVCNEHPEAHAILLTHNDEPDRDLREFLEIVQQRRLGWCCDSESSRDTKP